MLNLRIFLSSPGDLAPERLAAREVVDRLQRGPVWGGQVHIDLIAWDDPYAGVPMEAQATPQDSVSRYAGLPRDCDLTVVLLWSRLGTPLPANQTRADGSRFESGTVWEYEDARQAGRPVWIYRCTRKVLLDADAANIDSLRAQRAAVRTFFERFTHADGSLPGGINTYDTREDFAREFELHLNAELRRRTEAAKAAGWPTAWDFSAYMLSKRARFIGRDWLFSAIETWLARPSPRALLVRADFGVGKSALMAEFIHRDAQRTDDERRVVGYHFCQHDTRQTLRPVTFVRSLVAQLAGRISAYRDALQASPDLLVQLERAEDPGSMFEAAVLNPLTAIPAPAGIKLVLIDALDESLENGADPAELATSTSSATIVSLLSAKVSRFPPWLRLLVTSRNNPAVLNRLKGAFGVQEIDAEAGLNQDDIERYVLMRCADASIADRLAAANMPAEAAARALRDKSGGKFLYAKRALDDLANGLIDAAEMPQLPPGMDAFYLDAFERRFSRGERDYAPASALLGVMAAALEPLAPGMLADVLRGGQVHGENALKALRAEALSDFIRVRDGLWTFDHFSLREWLCNEDDDGNPRAGAFAVDLAVGRGKLADWGLRQFAADFQDCPPHVLRHLCAYLQAAGRADARRTLLYDLRWLRAKLFRTGVLSLLADFDEAAVDGSVTLLGRTLAMCAHILGRCPDQLSAQLLGRLPNGNDATLDGLLAECRGWRGATWLQPLVPSLPPPGHLLRVLQGHADVVQHAIFSPDGEFVLTASTDHTARLWRRSGEVVAELVGHTGAVNHVALSPDGELIATASEDCSVRLWSRMGDPVATLEFKASVIDGLFSTDGSTLLAVLRQRSSPLMDLEGHHKALLEGHRRSMTCAQFSPSGECIVTASNDGTARLWDAQGKPQAVLTGHEQAVVCSAFSPSKPLVLTTSADGTARLWQRDGREVAKLSGHTATVNHGAFSADGRLVVTCSNDNTARLWRDDGSPVAVLRGHDGWVNSVAFSPDGGTIATGACDNDVRLWSSSGHMLAELRGHTGWVVHTAFSPDGRHVLTSSRDATARLWRTDAQDLPTRAGHDADVTCITLRRDGKLVLSGSYDHTARLWGADGTPRTVLRGHDDWVTRVAFSANGGTLLTASCDGTARLWSVEGELLVCLQGHAATINHAGFVAGGGFVVTASNDRTARVWSVDGASCVVLEGHDDTVNHAEASRDGALIVTASNDRTARLWSRDGKCVAVLEAHEGWVQQARFTPNGRHVITVSLDCTARRWDLDGHLISGSDGHSGPIDLVVFDNTEGRIAIACRDGAVRLWPEAGETWTEIVRHGAPITCVAFGEGVAPGGISVASGSEDGRLCVTSLSGGVPAVTTALDVDAPINSLDCYERLIVCGDALGHVHFLRLVA